MSLNSKEIKIQNEKNRSEKIDVCISQWKVLAAKLLIENFSKEESNIFVDKKLFVENNITKILIAQKQVDASVDLFSDADLESIFSFEHKETLVSDRSIELSKSDIWNIMDFYLKYHLGGNAIKYDKVSWGWVTLSIDKENDSESTFVYETTITNWKRKFLYTWKYLLWTSGDWLTFDNKSSKVTQVEDNRRFKISGWNYKDELQIGCINCWAELAEDLFSTVKEQALKNWIVEENAIWNGHSLINESTNENLIKFKMAPYKVSDNSHEEKIINSIRDAVKYSQRNKLDQFVPKVEQNSQVDEFTQAKEYLYNQISSLIETWWKDHILAIDIYDQYNSVEDFDKEKKYIDELGLALQKEWKIKFLVGKEWIKISLSEELIDDVVTQIKKVESWIHNTHESFLKYMLELPAAFDANQKIRIWELDKEFDQALVSCNNELGKLKKTDSDEFRDDLEENEIYELQSAFFMLNKIEEWIRNEIDSMKYSSWNQKISSTSLGWNSEWKNTLKTELLLLKTNIKDLKNKYETLGEISDSGQEEILQLLDEADTIVATLQTSIDWSTMNPSQNQLTARLSEIFIECWKLIDLEIDSNSHLRTMWTPLEDDVYSDEGIDFNAHNYSVTPLWSSLWAYCNITWLLNEATGELYKLVSVEQNNHLWLRDTDTDYVKKLENIKMLLRENWISDYQWMVSIFSDLNMWSWIFKTLQEKIAEKVWNIVFKENKENSIKDRFAVKFLSQFSWWILSVEQFNSLLRNVVEPMFIGVWSKTKIDKDKFEGLIKDVLNDWMNQHVNEMEFSENALLNQVSVRYFKDDISKKLAEWLWIMDFEEWYEDYAWLSDKQLATNLKIASTKFFNSESEKYKNTKKFWKKFDSILDKIRWVRRLIPWRFAKKYQRDFDMAFWKDDMELHPWLNMAIENQWADETWFKKVSVSNNIKSWLVVSYEHGGNLRWSETTISSTDGRWDDIFQKIIESDDTHLTQKKKLQLAWSVMGWILKAMQDRVWEISWEYEWMKWKVYFDDTWKIYSTLDDKPFVTSETMNPLFNWADENSAISLWMFQIMWLYRLYKSIIHQKKERVENIMDEWKLKLKTSVYFEWKELNEWNWFIDSPQVVLDNWKPKETDTRFISFNNNKFKEWWAFFMLDSETKKWWAIAFYKNEFIYLHKAPRNPEVELPSGFETKWMYDKSKDKFSNLNLLFQEKDDVTNVSDYIDVMSSYTKSMIKKHFALKELWELGHNREFYFDYNDELYSVKSAPNTPQGYQIARIIDNDNDTSRKWINKLVLLKKKRDALAKLIKERNFSYWWNPKEFEKELKRMDDLLLKWKTTISIKKRWFLRYPTLLKKKRYHHDIVWSDYGYWEWKPFWLWDTTLKIKRESVSNLPIMNDIEFAWALMKAMSDSTRNVAKTEMKLYKRMYHSIRLAFKK